MFNKSRVRGPPRPEIGFLAFQKKKIVTPRFLPVFSQVDFDRDICLFYVHLSLFEFLDFSSRFKLPVFWKIAFCIFLEKSIKIEENLKSPILPYCQGLCQNRLVPQKNAKKFNLFQGSIYTLEKGGREKTFWTPQTVQWGASFQKTRKKHPFFSRKNMFFRAESADVDFYTLKNHQKKSPKKTRFSPPLYMDVFEKMWKNTVSKLVAKSFFLTW